MHLRAQIYTKQKLCLECTTRENKSRVYQHENAYLNGKPNKLAYLWECNIDPTPTSEKSCIRLPLLDMEKQLATKYNWQKIWAESLQKQKTAGQELLGIKRLCTSSKLTKDTRAP